MTKQAGDTVSQPTYFHHFSEFTDFYKAMSLVWKLDVYDIVKTF